MGSSPTQLVPTVRSQLPDLGGSRQRAFRISGNPTMQINLHRKAAPVVRGAVAATLAVTLAAGVMSLAFLITSVGAAEDSGRRHRAGSPFTASQVAASSHG